jgi:hypothetical protein
MKHRYAPWVERNVFEMLNTAVDTNNNHWALKVLNTIAATIDK